MRYQVCVKSTYFTATLGKRYAPIALLRSYFALYKQASENAYMCVLFLHLIYKHKVHIVPLGVTIIGQFS